MATDWHWSHIFNIKMVTLIVRSPDPVANHVLLGSTAMHLTHPRWPLITWCYMGSHDPIHNNINTLISFHGACHVGLMTAVRLISWLLLTATSSYHGILLPWIPIHGLTHPWSADNVSDWVTGRWPGRRTMMLTLADIINGSATHTEWVK